MLLNLERLDGPLFIKHSKAAAGGKRVDPEMRKEWRLKLFLPIKGRELGFLREPGVVRRGGSWEFGVEKVPGTKAG